jgi:hypothetical protein
MTLLQMATKPTSTEKVVEKVIETIEVPADVTADLEKLNQLAESFIL